MREWDKVMWRKAELWLAVETRVVELNARHPYFRPRVAKPGDQCEMRVGWRVYQHHFLLDERRILGYDAGHRWPILIHSVGRVPRQHSQLFWGGGNFNSIENWYLKRVRLRPPTSKSVSHELARGYICTVPYARPVGDPEIFAGPIVVSRDYSCIACGICKYNGCTVQYVQTQVIKKAR
jgi:hypothetical protein